MSDTETALTITIPEGARQVLVRVPVVPVNEVQVDFRQTAGDTWTPSEFFADSVQVVVQ